MIWKQGSKKWKRTSPRAASKQIERSEIWNHPKVDGLAFGADGTRIARLGPGAIPLDTGTRPRTLRSLVVGEGRGSSMVLQAKTGSVSRRSKDRFVVVIRGPETRGLGNRKRWRPLPTDSFVGYRLFHSLYKRRP